MLVVNNDYPQGATERCGTAAVTLQAGNHTLYVEGWSNSAALSITATFQGADTLSNKVAIPGTWPCLPNAPGAGDSNFVICGYKADNSVNVAGISNFFDYYNQAWLLLSF